ERSRGFGANEAACAGGRGNKASTGQVAAEATTRLACRADAQHAVFLAKPLLKRPRGCHRVQPEQIARRLDLRATAIDLDHAPVRTLALQHQHVVAGAAQRATPADLRPGTRDTPTNLTAAAAPEHTTSTQ